MVDNNGVLFGKNRRENFIFACDKMMYFYNIVTQMEMLLACHQHVDDRIS